MTPEATALKTLLRAQHRQEHRAFRRAYDRAAAQVDPEQRGGAPSKATFYRWLAGDLRGLPHPAHCRVLEQMFPGWTAAALFAPATTGPSDEPSPTPGPPAERTSELAGVEAAFASRAEFGHRVGPRELFDGARQVRASGLSLNTLCQQYGDRNLARLLDGGCAVSCLFLDPAGEAIRAREREEGLTAGHLSSLTELNIQVLERLRAMLDPGARARLEVRTSDEPVRFNISLIDDEVCVVQTYLPRVRGVDSPTLVLRAGGEDPGLYEVFDGVFEALWERASPR